MSRSMKKSPFVPVCSIKPGEQKAWKRQSAKRARLAVKRDILQGGDGGGFARESIYLAPADGHVRIRPECRTYKWIGK